MKKLVHIALLIALISLSIDASAGIYMGENYPNQKAIDSKGGGSSFTSYKFTVTDGSLKAIVERIVKQSGWGKVVWTLPYDFDWVGNTTFASDTVQGVLEQLLKGYPVQAVFYNENHIVAIVPRSRA